MNTLDKNQRYLIHGFHYEISRNGELWNTNSGRLIRPGSDGRYLLRKQKRMYRFTLGRLLYAVEHGVSSSHYGRRKTNFDNARGLLPESRDTFQA